MQLVPNMTLFLPLLFPFSAAQNTTNTTSPSSSNPASTPNIRHIISAAQAQAIISSSSLYAASHSTPQNIAVVDPFGLLVAFLRMDDAYVGSIDISVKKARTSVLFNGGPSAAYYDAVQPGAPLYGVDNTNGGLVVFGGGLPVYVDGVLIGGVGVSGGTIEQDVESATAGVEGIGASCSLV